MQEALLMDKKGGLEHQKVAGFVLAVFILVVLLAFSGKWSLVSNDLTVEEKCRTSVLRNARYHVAGIELGTEIDCPTRKLELKKEDSDNDNKKAKEKLARSMYGCWRQFGQGKLNLFNENKVFCNVCYIVDVKTEEPITNFEDYLKYSPSPTENEYYADYLKGGKKSEGLQEENIVEWVDKLFNKPLKRADEIDLEKLNTPVIYNEAPNNKYAVIFVYAKGHSNVEKMVRQLSLQSAGGKVITPIAIGVAVGATVTAAVFAAPAVVVVGTGAALFVATEYVGQIFNPDTPPEWAAFTVLRQWNADVAPEILRNEIGCQEFVETQSN